MQFGKMVHPLLVLVMLVLGTSAQVLRYVKPMDSSPTRCPPGQLCLTLNEYIFPKQSTAYFTSGSTFIFLAGNHTLDLAVTLANVEDVKFRGEGNANLICGNGVSVLFENTIRLHVDGLRFLFNSTPNFISVLMLRNSHQVQISNTAFQGDSRKPSRAMYSVHSTVKVTNCFFGGTTGKRGGAVLARFSDISFNQSFFSRSKANNGGAIATVDTLMRITSCSFVGNWANLVGGAISAANSVLVVTGSSFDNNTAVIEGGALFSVNSNVTLLQSRCIGNVVEIQGGALSSSQSYINATSNTFTKNHASCRGGAINAATSNIVLTNNSFAGNSAEKRGGAVFGNESILNIMGNVFSRNDANTSGSAVFLTKSTLYRNETLRNIFELNGGDKEVPIACNSCRITSIGGKNAPKDEAHLAQSRSGQGVISSPATVAVYSNSRVPGDGFVSIIASPNETKIVLTGNATQGGEQYMLYSIANPTSFMAFFKRSGRPAVVRGINDLINLGRAMKNNFNFYTNLGTVINGQCSDCNLKLLGIGYFVNNNVYLSNKA